MHPEVILGIIWILFWIYWLSAAFYSKQNATTNTRSASARLVIFFLAIILLRYSTSGLEPTAPIRNPLSLAAGFILVAIGLGTCLWARFSMGTNWGMPMSQKIDTEIVTSGPYHFIRHPIYSGLLLAGFGSCFIVGFYSLIVLSVVAAYFIYSARVEERNLIKKLPDRYSKYRSHTKMFIPFVI
jgi:protein-S-isoprenylcysteine O-methyltransferase Ste14